MPTFARLTLALAVLSVLGACPTPVVGVDPDAGETNTNTTLDDAGATGGGGGGGGGGTLDDGGSTGGGGVPDAGPDAGPTDAGTAPTDAGTFVDANQFCDLWAAAYCDREARCLFLDSAQNTTCLARVKDACATYQRFVTAGVYRYDTAVGAACINATGNLACAVGRGFTGGALNFDLGQGPAACDPLLVGVGVAGTPCTSTADCAAGFTCPAANGSTACRACTAIPSIGQVCNPVLNTPCFNASCRSAGDGGNECFAYALAGQPCTATSQCDPATTTSCGPLPSDGGARLCVSKETDGITCASSATCLTGYCNAGNRTDAGVRTCGTVADGRACGSANDCVSGSFCEGLVVNSRPGTCRPRLALGAPCTITRAGDGNDGCAEGGACFDGVCKPRANLQQVGQQCRSTTADCANGGYCPNLPNDGGYPSCLAQGLAGANCGSSAECQPGLRCTNNTCQPLSSAGQPCLAAQQCKGALSCPLVDAGLGFFACTPLASPGSDCSVSGITCASGVDNGQGGFCARDGGFTGPGTCSAPLMVGGDCGSNAQCASGRCLTADGGAVGLNTRGTCATPCVP